MSFAHPSGPHSDELRAFFIEAGHSDGFRRKVNFAWRVGRHVMPFPWDEFQVNLCEAEFREFRGKQQALCFGWAGRNPESDRPQWLFGLFGPFWRRRNRGRWIMWPWRWLLRHVGRSAADHELYHAVQDVRSNGVFFREEGKIGWGAELVMELEAHAFGGLLIGWPSLGILFGSLPVGGVLIAREMLTLISLSPLLGLITFAVLATIVLSLIWFLRKISTKPSG